MKKGISGSIMAHSAGYRVRDVRGRRRYFDGTVHAKVEFEILSTVL